MAVKKEIEIVVKSDQAVQGLNRVEDALERVDKAAEEATEETKGLGQEVGESGAAISLLDAATGGLASRVRDVSEVYKQFRGRITAVTFAQLKANAAFLANPVVLVTTAVVAATGALAKYASKLTGDVVPVTTSLKNIFLSLGDAARFARLQAESYTEFSTEQQIKETERAIAVLKAYGQDTIDLEIENQRRRLSAFKEGSQEYFDAQTQLAVLIAQKDVAATKAAEEEKARIAEEEKARKEKAAAEEEARVKKEFANRQENNKKIKDENELAVANFQNKIASETRLQSKGISEGLKIYQAGKEQEQKVDQVTADQKLQLASQTFGAIAGILGQNSKAGKAAGIAQAIINTYQGVTEVLKNPTTIPEPFGTIQKIASTATVLASGFQAVRAMQQTPIPVVAAGGGFGGGAGVAVSAPPQINTVGAGSINQLAQTISGQEKEPVRAYVVAGDVTTAQSLERNTVREASI